MSWECIRCGYCCKQRPCAFGDWDNEKGRCRALKGDAPGSYSCAKHDEIIKDEYSEVNPAFGAGCCATLNHVRRELINGRQLLPK